MYSLLLVLLVLVLLLLPSPLLLNFILPRFRYPTFSFFNRLIILFLCRYCPIIVPSLKTSLGLPVRIDSRIVNTILLRERSTGR